MAAPWPCTGSTSKSPPGEIFGLLGPNGAGKTTLLSIICLPADCRTPAKSVSRARRVGADDRELRRLIGIVPQELALYGELTARENLSFFGRLYGLTGATLAGRVLDVLDLVGLRDRADDRVESFSGGMKRRLNLGAALVHQPRLLLLDEPTTGVDPQSRNHIFEEVRRLNAAGLTIVYTSHYMEEVQALCPRVGIIDHGRLIACDTLPNLLQAAARSDSRPGLGGDAGAAPAAGRAARRDAERFRGVNHRAGMRRREGDPGPPGHAAERTATWS